MLFCFFSPLNLLNNNILCVADCRLYFEGAHAPHTKKCGNKALIIYEVLRRLPDKYGNPYPTGKKLYIVVF